MEQKQQKRISKMVLNKVSRPFNIAVKEGADNEVANDFITYNHEYRRSENRSRQRVIFRLPIQKHMMEQNRQEAQ